MHADERTHHGHSSDDGDEGGREQLPEPGEALDPEARLLPAGVEAPEQVGGAELHLPELALRHGQRGEGLAEGSGDVGEAGDADVTGELAERGLERPVPEADLLDVPEEVAAQEGRAGRLVEVGGEQVAHAELELALTWRGEGRADGALVQLEELLSEHAVGGEALGRRDVAATARVRHQPRRGSLLCTGVYRTQGKN